MTYHIFIGYDDREHEAFLVAKHSILKHTTVPVKIHKLHHKDLRKEGLYYRDFFVEGPTGQYVDCRDERPFSTQFTFTRFLIGELWKKEKDLRKSPLCLFMDCDFLVMQDIGELFKEIEEKRKTSRIGHPVYCVKHDYNPRHETKMDNVSQSTYNMKLWAAMFVLDMDHLDNLKLTPHMVNTEGGRDLMNFCWVTDLDTIHGVDEKWQFIPNHSEDRVDIPSIIHWTEGGPYFPHLRESCKYGDIWFAYYKELVSEKLDQGIKGLEELIDG